MEFFICFVFVPSLFLDDVWCSFVLELCVSLSFLSQCVLSLFSWFIVVLTIDWIFCLHFPFILSCGEVSNFLTWCGSVIFPCSVDSAHICAGVGMVLTVSVLRSVRCYVCFFVLVFSFFTFCLVGLVFSMLVRFCMISIFSML